MSADGIVGEKTQAAIDSENDNWHTGEQQTDDRERNIAFLENLRNQIDAQIQLLRGVK